MPWIAKAFLRRKNTSRGIITLDLELQHRSMKTMKNWH